jgi:hypothetical protein
MAIGPASAMRGYLRGEGIDAGDAGLDFDVAGHGLPEM